jgi:hypothetical protein
MFSFIPIEDTVEVHYFEDYVFFMDLFIEISVFRG